MPQWRKLHVKTVDSLDINDMPDDFHRLMWLLMPLGLDSAGRAIDDAGWIKSKLFPLRRDVTFEMVEQAMVWYAERGMIERYTVDNRPYFQVPTFAKYQGKTDREAASVIPEPVKQTKRSRSRPTHELVTSKSSLDVDVDVEERESAGAPPPSTTPAIQAEYETLLGRKLEKSEWSRGESSAAKTIAEKYTLEQLRRAYQHYKAQPFWSDKRLTLGYMAKNMHDLLNGKHKAAGQPAESAGPWRRGNTK